MPLLPAREPRQPIPIVVVAYGRDLPLLVLQARSFAIHLAREPGRPILVINNDNDAPAFAEAFAREVMPHYGPHAAEVRLVPREACLAGFDGLNGWRRQQLLKWAASRLVPPGLYLTLDSKNCLLRPWSSAGLLTAEGRIRLGPRRPDETLRPAFRYFNPEMPEPERLAYIWTPFALLTRHVSAMIEAIGEREPGGAFELLARDASLTEYGLYWSYLVSRRAEWLYDLGQPSTVAGFRFSGRDNPDLVFEAIRQPHIAWLGLHARVAGVAPAMRRRVAQVLAEHGLFADAAAATRFLEGFARGG
jgi:hypothetical protein